MNSLLNDIKYLVFTKSTTLIFGLLTSILLARKFGPELNGKISTLIFYPILIFTFSTLGIRQSVTYFLAKKIYKEQELKSAAISICFMSSAISFVLCLILLIVLCGIEFKFALIISLAIPFKLFNNNVSGIYLAKNDFKIFTRLNWIPVVVTFFSTFTLIYIFNYSIEAYFVSILLGSVAVTLLLFSITSIKLNNIFIFNKIIIKDLVILGITFSFGMILINLNMRLDVILLDYLSNVYEVGIYSKGTSVSEYILQVPLLLSSLIFSRSAASSDNLLFSTKTIVLVRYSFYFILPLSLIIFIFSEEIVLFLFGQSFISSSNVIRSLLPGVFFLTIFTIVNMDLAGRGKPIYSVKAMLPALIINIALNYIFIPKMGSIGASISSSISYFFATFILLKLYSNFTKVSVLKIFNFKISDFDFFKFLKR